MAQQEVKPQPGQKFDPGKSFLVKGSTLNRLLDAALPVTAGKGLREFQTAKGKVIMLDGELGVAGGSPCPFGYVYVDGSATKLQGGSVTGGETNTPVDPITLDMDSADYVHVWLKVDYTPNKADDVLLPGVENLTDVDHGAGSSIPDNSLPTMASPTGTMYIDLGYYYDGEFYPSGCGNFTISHCPGFPNYGRA
jgi:hypothetical protein